MPTGIRDLTRRRARPKEPPHDDNRPIPRFEPWDMPTHPLADHFQDIRRLRRFRHQQRPPFTRPQTRALLTMVYNEAVYLPIWLRYYSRFFAPQDIYVLDNQTTDGSTRRRGFQRIEVANDTVDHEWMVRTIERYQRELLTRYDIVVVTDVDEMIIVGPGRGDLGTYLDWFDEEWVNCLGYELIHFKDREPPLKLKRPILRQRGYWYVNGAYDKAAIARAPMQFKPGFHGRTDNQTNFDPDLLLVHLHRMDFEICRQRHLVRANKRWADDDADRQWASHNLVTGDEFERWFYGSTGFEGFGGYEIRPEPIPDVWRGAF